MSQGRNIIEELDRLGRVTRAVQFSDGLNPAQWEALRFLARANKYSRTAGALTKFLGATKGTVSQTVSALEEKGLIAKVRSEVDRRIVELEVTKAGSALISNDPLLPLVRLAESLPDTISDGLQRMLAELTAAIQAQQHMKCFGVCWPCQRFIAIDPGAEALARCGLTGEPMSDTETRKICVNYQQGDGQQDLGTNA